MLESKKAATVAERNDLPGGLSRPAKRALAGAGIHNLDRLAQTSEDEVCRLHGMGPKAIGQLKEALASTGRQFAEE